MPLNYDQIIAGVRLDLLEPDEWRPGDDFIMQKAGDVVQELLTDSANTLAEWALRKTEHTQAQGEQQLVLADAVQMGKPVRVEVFDPYNTRLRPGKVELLGVHNRDSFPGGYDAASFYRVAEDQAPVLDFLQPATQQRSIRIWWEWGELPFAAKASVLPVQHPAHRLVRVLTSLATISAAWWSALAQGLTEAQAEKAMEPRRLAITGNALNGTGLAGQAAQMRQTWDNYKWANREAGEGLMIGYAEEYEQLSRSDYWFRW